MQLQAKCPTTRPSRVVNPLRSPDLIAVSTLGQFAEHPRVAALREFITDWYVSYLSIRFTNCYGMERQDTTEADDWQAFSSIQTARYLLGKNKRTFATLAEKDMIGDLIRDSWQELVECRHT